MTNQYRGTMELMGMWPAAGGAPIIVAPTVPGLEASAGDHRLHAHADSARLHARAEDHKLHGVTIED